MTILLCVIWFDKERFIEKKSLYEQQNSSPFTNPWIKRSKWVKWGAEMLGPQTDDLITPLKPCKIIWVLLHSSMLLPFYTDVLKTKLTWCCYKLILSVSESEVYWQYFQFKILNHNMGKDLPTSFKKFYFTELQNTFISFKIRD